MTCIVGVIDKEGVVMGADSAAITKYNVSVRKDPKIFKVDKFLIGCTTSFRMTQLLQYRLNLPTFEGSMDGDDLNLYMCTRFIDTVRELFSVNGFMKRSNQQNDEGGEFLVGYENRLFTVYEDFQVAENDCTYSSVGCGEELALGALSAIDILEKNDSITLSAEAKVNMALKAANKHCAGMCEPFIVYKTY